MTFGHVRFWNRDEGWGVLDGAEVPGGCWAHLSAIDIAGFRQLHASQEVRFLFEPGKQDGYDYRATAITVDGSEPSIHEPSPSYGAYQSSVHIRFELD